MDLVQKKLKILENNVEIQGKLIDSINKSADFIKEQHKKYNLLTEITTSHELSDNLRLRKDYSDYYSKKIEHELSQIHSKLVHKNKNLMNIIEKQVRR